MGILAADHRGANPMFPIALSLIVGVVVARYWEIVSSQIICWFLLALLVGVALFLDIARGNARPILLLLIALCGFLLYTLRCAPPEEAIAFDQNIDFTARTVDDVTHKGRYDQCRVQLLSYKDSTSGVWLACNSKVELNIDTALRIEPQRGNVLAFRGKLRRVEGSYGDWLTSQGVVGKVYSYRSAIVDSTTVPLNFKERMAERRARIAQQIHQIDTTERAATAIMSALTISDKTELSRELKSDYRRAGASHLLAISGLHIGIVFAMLNLLLGFVKLFRYGRVVFSLIVIALLFLYAIFTGMSPSVMRAVVMFSLLQVALMSSRSYSSLNILSTAAIVLLVADPNYLFDIGFQLSFAAMMGIVTLYRPVASLLMVENRVLYALWSVTVVSVVAQIAVLPMVTYYFGQIPLLGLVVNICVWITVPLIIVGTFLFLSTSLAVVGVATLYVTKVQNAFIGFISSHSYASIEGVDMPLWLCLFSYAIIIALALLFVRARAKIDRRVVLGAKYNF